MLNGVLRPFGIRHSTFGIRHSAFGIRHSTFSIRHSAFDIRHSTAFGIRLSAFDIRHSAFDIRHSALTRIMKVLLTRRIPSSVLSKLEGGCDVDLYDGPGGMPADELTRRIADKEALISVLTDRVTPELLDAAPKLRIVSNIAVGYENIDVAAARARGVVVTNTPDVLTEATAELTWALILAAARRVAEGDRLIRRHGWKGWSLDFMLGTELRGKRLGIVGAGRIGRAVAAKAPAFGMEAVLGRRQTIDQLLVSSDVISVHVPGGAETRHLFDRKAFARMKRSAIFVNTSRGSVVDEDAIVWALKERLIAAAALDVFEHEPAVREELLAMDHVVLTPHLGSATRETRTAMIDLAVSNVLAVAAGRPPMTPV
jgi:glyoxylate reductase